MDNRIFNAAKVLVREFPDSIIEGYWDNGTEIIFKTKFTGAIGCNLFVVNGSKVVGTNPMRIDVNLSDMKRFRR